MSSGTGALVLAGGVGARALPRDKLLVAGPDGRTMIGRVTAALAASRIDAVVIVTGHRPERIALACPGVALVVAGDHREGMAASLRRGIEEAVRLGWDGALVCLADMPLVTVATLDRLAGALHPDGGRPDAVVPMAGGRRGNPVRWDRRMFPALLALRGDAGARSLLQGPGCDVLAIETGDRGVLEDFDDPARLAWFESGCEPGSEPRSGPRSGPSLIGRGD